MFQMVFEMLEKSTKASGLSAAVCKRFGSVSLFLWFCMCCKSMAEDKVARFGVLDLRVHVFCFDRVSSSCGD